MDQAADKEERKREYNRLAQREFRRRRKEHLKGLEQAQKEQNSEQSEEIERLRYQNDELRRENDALRTQVYGTSASSNSTHGLISPPINVPSILNDNRQFSVSPSLSGTSVSAHGSPAQSLGQDMVPIAALSLTSSMLPPLMQAYADPSALSSQPYSMVHESGLRHSSQSSPESSGYRNASRSTMGPSFQALNISQSARPQPSQMSTQTKVGGPSNVITSYDRIKAQTEILAIFRPLFSDPSVISSPEKHLAVLRSMSDSLPPILKPSKLQLQTPHYYGIDMIASPALRDRLMTVTSEVAQSFVAEIGILGGDLADQITIWGEESLNEMSWEFSQPILERWAWLLGRDWISRANWWRRQRGVALLPEW